MYLNVCYQLQFYYNITTYFKKITKLIFLIPLGKKQSYVKHLCQNEICFVLSLHVCLCVCMFPF